MSQTIWTIRAIATRTKRVIARRKNRSLARGARSRKVLTGFSHYPEPRSIGNFETGQDLCAHIYAFAGKKVDGNSDSIWDVKSPSQAFDNDLHGFAWLDDLAAAGDKTSRNLAQSWVREWITLYGSGRDKGWSPALAGQRVMRICSHGRFLFRALDGPHRAVILDAIGRDLNYLGKAWSRDETTLGRLRALTGLIYGGVTFEGREKPLNYANKSLGEEAAHHIDSEGEIASRAPEELMDIFTLLTWSCRTMQDAKVHPDPRILNALERIAPTLRSLRLGDGSLTRFHGGGRGRPGRLDQVLSDSRVRRSRAGKLAMGYDRITAGRVTLLMDCDKPPPLEASAHAHASTLAFELSSGRYPIFVNCGAGQKFGKEWEEVCRATGAHNTITIGGTSSSTIAADGFVSRTFGQRLLTEPLHVTRKRHSGVHGNGIFATHDGFASTSGVIHEREVAISIDGRVIDGADTVLPADNKSRGKGPQHFSTRFHLHPDLTVELSDDEQKAAITLPNAEVWEFTFGGKMSIEDSVYLDQWNLKPLATKQIVVSAPIVEYAGQITWTMTRVSDGERPKFAARETSATT